MKKKRKRRVGTVEITPGERKRIKKRIKKHFDQLRKKYAEIRGKRIDWIDHRVVEDNVLYVGVKFMDGTYFTLVFTPQVVTNRAELADVSSGDEIILRTYYQGKHLTASQF